MEEDERRALAGLTVRDRVALDLREIQLRVSHPMGPCFRSRERLADYRHRTRKRSGPRYYE